MTDIPTYNALFICTGNSARSILAVPWATLLVSVVLYIVIPVVVAQLWRRGHHHDLSQPDLRHLAQRAGLDPQQRRTHDHRRPQDATDAGNACQAAGQHGIARA